MPAAKQISRKINSTSSRNEGLSLLVANNQTSRSVLALSAAAQLVGEGLSRLEIVQVVDPRKSREEVQGILEQLEESIQGKLPENPGQVTLTIKGYPDYLENEDTAKAQALRDFSRESTSDLLIIGRHAAKSSGHSFMGTMSARLLEQPGCPVLVAVNTPPRPYTHIAIAVDFSIASPAILRAVETLLPPCKVTLIHVLSKDSLEVRTKAQAELSSLAQDLSNAEFSVSHRFGIGRPAQALNSIIVDANIDLLVMGTHGRTGLQKVLLGSVSQELIDTPPCDVLAVFPE